MACPGLCARAAAPAQHCRQVAKRPRAQAHRLAPARASAAVSPASDATQQLEAFYTAVRGEYEGVSATFGADGAPLELPEQYVPAAYREWEVKLYDWQTQCSVEAAPAGLAYTLKRLLPTVGVSGRFAEHRVMCVAAIGRAVTSGARPRSVKQTQWHSWTSASAAWSRGRRRRFPACRTAVTSWRRASSPAAPTCEWRRAWRAASRAACGCASAWCCACSAPTGSPRACSRSRCARVCPAPADSDVPGTASHTSPADDTSSARGDIVGLCRQALERCIRVRVRWWEACNTRGIADYTGGACCVRLCALAQLHHERHVGDFNGGTDLCGCGGGMTPFATQACPSLCAYRPAQPHECFKMWWAA
jgi:hypothetical protein